MNLKDFTKKELAETLELINLAIVCKQEHELRHLLERTKELVCSDHSICGLGRYNKKGLIEAVNIINGSYPEEWFMVYEDKQLYNIDPIVSQHYKYFDTQLWADTYKKFDDEQTHRFISDATDFGLNYGITSGARSPDLNMASILTFSNRKDDFKERHKSLMTVIAPHIHQALLRMNRELRRKPIEAMTDREKEILYWMREGKSNWDISMILNISERTVKFHVQNIERKLDAVNKVQAVAIAMDNQLLA